MEEFISYGVVFCGVVIASFTDCTRYKVYNNLTFPMFFGGLLFGACMGGMNGFLASAGGATLAFILLMLPYVMGGLGAGDVKFMMAIGSWVGSGVLLLSILIGCLVLVIYHLIKSARNMQLREVYENVKLMLIRVSLFSRNLTYEDNFETVQSAANSEQSPNRARLMPFSALMSVGILFALIISRLLR